MSEQKSEETTGGQRLVLEAVLRTDVGRVRSENQDFGVLTTSREEREGHVGRLLVVADGMGGHRGGATASRLAALTVKAQYLGAETSDMPTALRDALTRANARVFSEAQANPDLRGMGTTTSALAVRDQEAWIGHVGDSRIYLVRGDSIRQLTEDHSLVATMVREGLLTPQEAENHPRRNVLQRSMGVGDQVEIDVYGPIDIENGDTFILCSDGLHGLVKEPELREIATAPIAEAAEEFLKRALERGAPDNVTVIVARAVPESEAVIDSEELLDQTQPLEATTDYLDETVPDVPPRIADASGVSGDGASKQSTNQAPATSAQPPKPAARVLTWVLLAVLAIAAVGAALVVGERAESSEQTTSSQP